MKMLLNFFLNNSENYGKFKLNIIRLPFQIERHLAKGYIISIYIYI